MKAKRLLVNTTFGSIGDILILTGPMRFYNISTKETHTVGLEVSKCSDVNLLEPIYGTDTVLYLGWWVDISYTIRFTPSTGSYTMWSTVHVSNKSRPASEVAVNATKRKRKTKLKKDYYETEAEVRASVGEINSAMLLTKYEDRIDKTKYPILASAKRDGVRSYRNLMSRTNLVQFTAPHISRELDMIGLPLDGELYIPGKTFQEIESIALDPDHPDKRLLEYHVFDVVIPNESFLIRFDKVVKSKISECKHIKMVEYVLINNKEEDDKFYKLCLEQGYEGVVYRTLTQKYESVRSREVFKRKPLYSGEFRVVGCEKDMRDLNYSAGLIEFIIDVNGKTQKVIPAWSKDRRDCWNHPPFVKYYGRYVTVEYRGLTDDGLLKHAVMKDFRDLDSSGNPII